jgi:hypothetical protein
MKSTHSAVVLGLGLSGLMSLTGCDDVHNPDEAIAAAEKACTNAVENGSVPPKPGDKPRWYASSEKLADGGIDGWDVSGDYDASGNGVLAYVRVKVFIPRRGKPTQCTGTVD